MQRRVLACLAQRVERQLALQLVRAQAPVQASRFLLWLELRVQRLEHALAPRFKVLHLGAIIVIIISLGRSARLVVAVVWTTGGGNRQCANGA